jgi:hypothetical protein
VASKRDCFFCLLHNCALARCVLSSWQLPLSAASRLCCIIQCQAAHFLGRATCEASEHDSAQSLMAAMAKSLRRVSLATEWQLLPPFCRSKPRVCCFFSESLRRSQAG